MRLSTVLADVDVIAVDGDPDVAVSDVTFTTDGVVDGSLFCCLPGRNRDGHDFAEDAVRRGAGALLVERPVVAGGATQVRVLDTRRAMGLASASFHGHPSRRLTTIGVTGTNGKSTTVHLLKTIFDAAGRPCGSIGTMNNVRTTPEAPDLQRDLATFVADGKTAAAIEVSSVGLLQRRVDGVRFAAAVFTNLSPDELWIHRTMDDYFRAKASLFDGERTPIGVVNVDDEWGRRLADEKRGEISIIEFGAGDAADVRLAPGRSAFRWRGLDVDLPLDGAYNVVNAVAALTTAAALEVAPEVAALALADAPPLAGHGEEIAAGQPFRVLVDFAHTAGALTAVLRAARGEGRVLVVFGCGGDRDPGRRAPMGAAASADADVVIVTSDNPRTEDPMEIIDLIVRGTAQGGTADVVVEPDRRVAIEVAIAMARPNDAVVIAGKGHESGQIVGTTSHPFDDREVAAAALASMGYRAEESGS